MVCTWQLGIKGLPDELPLGLTVEKNEDLLKLLHTVIVDVSLGGLLGPLQCRLT